MKKSKFKTIVLSSILLASLNTPTSYAGGVPTFDGVNTGINMSDLVQSMMQTYKLIQQLTVERNQYAKQLDEYANQFGEMSKLLQDLEELSFIKTADGYIPADWEEAIAVLQGVSDNVPSEIKSQVDSTLNKFAKLDINDEVLKQNLVNQSEDIGDELKMYLTQMKVAQDRLNSGAQLSGKLGSVETQKEREAIMAQVGIENLKAQAETANMIAAKNATETDQRMQALQREKLYLENFNSFLGTRSDSKTEEDK